MAISVSARYGEAARHKFPNAKIDDIVIIDNSDGLGTQLVFWNTAIGPQMTETEASAELALIDAETARNATIASDSEAFANLLGTGTRAELGAHADQIVDIPSAVTKFKELYLYLASQARE